MFVADPKKVRLFVVCCLPSLSVREMKHAVRREQPIGGNIMAHASTTRLSLRKGRGNVVGTILTGLQGDVEGYYNYPYHGNSGPK